jgi:hypothetical protein
MIHIDYTPQSCTCHSHPTNDLEGPQRHRDSPRYHVLKIKKKKNGKRKKLVMSQLLKQCTQCKQNKSHDQFYKIGPKMCRECERNRQKQRYEKEKLNKLNDSEKIVKCNVCGKEVTQKCMKTGTKMCNECGLLRKDREHENATKRKRHADGPGRVIKQAYYQKNKKIIQQNAKKRLKLDPSAKKGYDMCIKLSDVLRAYFKTGRERTFPELGCKISEFVKYIESKFRPGMTWQNRGRKKDNWHIDHIIPLSKFDLVKEEDRKKCFHYTNCQPLWQAENVAKSNKIDIDIQTIIENAKPYTQTIIENAKPYTQTIIENAKPYIQTIIENVK